MMNGIAALEKLHPMKGFGGNRSCCSVVVEVLEESFKEKLAGQ